MDRDMEDICVHVNNLGVKQRMEWMHRHVYKAGFVIAQIGGTSVNSVHGYRRKGH